MLFRSEGYSSGKAPVELTTRRMRSLRSDLRLTIEAIRLNSGDDPESTATVTRDGSFMTAQPTIRLESADLKEVGRMQYLLDNLFRDGNVPNSLRPYADFVQKTRRMYRDEFDSIVEAKLQRDHKILEAAKSGEDTLDELDDRVWARSLVDIVEAEEVKPEGSKLVVSYNGQELYHETIGSGAFESLPDGAVVVFDYTTQGLIINLERTLTESDRIGSKRTEVEKAVLESLARDDSTKKYIDDVFTGINDMLLE